MGRMPQSIVGVVWFAAIASGCGGTSNEASAFPQPGDRAPAFTLPSADGGPVSLSDLRGRRVLLYFSMGPG